MIVNRFIRGRWNPSISDMVSIARVLMGHSSSQNSVSSLIPYFSPLDYWSITLTCHPSINTESELYDFRKALYAQFSYRADSAMDLLDALCSNQYARNPVELSLNPLFRRGHDSLFKAINQALVWRALCAQQCGHVAFSR